MKFPHTLAAVTAAAVMLSACGGGTNDSATTEASGNTAAATPAPGDGDSQGDAKVAGTNFNAVAEIPCAGYQGAAAGTCSAGVTRNGADGITVEVTLADGTRRLIFFNPDGSFLTFGTAEADGTAAMPITAEKNGDLTIAKLGSETYEIPDVFVLGD